MQYIVTKVLQSNPHTWSSPFHFPCHHLQKSYVSEIWQCLCVFVRHNYYCKKEILGAFGTCTMLSMLHSKQLSMLLFIMITSINSSLFKDNLYFGFTQSIEAVPTALFLQHTMTQILIPVSSSSWPVRNGCVIGTCHES